MGYVLERRGLLELILSVTMVIVMIVMMIHLIQNEWKNQSVKIGLKFWRLPPHTLCVFISCTLYLIFTLQSIFLSGYWILYARPYHTFYAPMCMITWTQLSWFTFAKVAMYLFWFVRLHQVFQATSFAIPVNKLKCLAILFNIPIAITAMYVHQLIAIL